MFKRPIVLLVLLLALAVPAFTAAEPPEFQRLRALAGSWNLVDTQGDPTDLRASYQVVAGRSAVIETLFSGTPEETVTIFHLEAGRVTATHLDARDDPVRLVPVESEDPDTLRFETRGQKPAEGRLAGIGLRFGGEQKLEVEWSITTEDANLATRSFHLMREAPIEELAAEVARLQVSVESLRKEIDRRLKRVVIVREKGAPDRFVLETRTMPPGPGWHVSGVPLRQFLFNQTTPFASTYSSEGDQGMTVAHYPFRAGKDCKVRFSVLGGHAYVAVVQETRPPPRRIKSIPEFATRLDAGDYGKTVERIVGGQWSKHAISVVWDLSKFEGKGMRLYIVDAVTNHYGQIAVSEVSIVEESER